MNVTDIRTRLGQLVAERHEAFELGLDADADYMSDLDEDIAATRQAYVGMAVTEIATLRGELSGRLQG